MAQRNSGYKRRKNDLYETPEWVTNALIPYLPPYIKIWEPACGSGKMVDVLVNHPDFKSVTGTDISMGVNFLQKSSLPYPTPNAIITNPPFSHAQQFIEHALELMQPKKGLVAMLLPTDFDAAKNRSHLFGECLMFSKKIILTKRIVWFKRKDGKKEAPSSNHAWYIWDYNHDGLPVIRYWYELQWSPTTTTSLSHPDSSFFGWA